MILQSRLGAEATLLLHFQLACFLLHLRPTYARRMAVGLMRMSITSNLKSLKD